jgi:hypothetical protein
MGEMAEYYLSLEDYLPDPFDHDDRDEGTIYRYRREPIRCKYCNSDGVGWSKAEGKWRLYSIKNKEPHTCDAYQRRR